MSVSVLIICVDQGGGSIIDRDVAFANPPIISSLDVHLTDRSRNLCPDVVDLGVQLLESKDLERVIRFGEEADETSSRWEAHHLGFDISASSEVVSEAQR